MAFWKREQKTRFIRNPRGEVVRVEREGEQGSSFGEERAAKKIARQRERQEKRYEKQQEKHELREAERQAYKESYKKARVEQARKRGEQRGQGYGIFNPSPQVKQQWDRKTSYHPGRRHRKRYRQQYQQPQQRNKSIHPYEYQRKMMNMWKIR